MPVPSSRTTFIYDAPITFAQSILSPRTLCSQNQTPRLVHSWWDPMDMFWTLLGCFKLPNMTPRQCSFPHSALLPRNLWPVISSSPGDGQCPFCYLKASWLGDSSFPGFSFPLLPQSMFVQSPSMWDMYIPFIITSSLPLSRIVISPFPSSLQTQRNTPHSASKIAILILF